jgi:hypothetical protein
MESHTSRGAIGPDELLAHNWRVWQLTRLGIPGPLAEAYADGTAWHQVARRCNTAARPGSVSFPPLVEWRQESMVCSHDLRGHHRGRSGFPCRLPG